MNEEENAAPASSVQRSSFRASSVVSLWFWGKWHERATGNRAMKWLAVLVIFALLVVIAWKDLALERAERERNQLARHWSNALSARSENQSASSAKSADAFSVERHSLTAEIDKQFRLRCIAETKLKQLAEGVK